MIILNKQEEVNLSFSMKFMCRSAWMNCSKWTFSESRFLHAGCIHTPSAKVKNMNYHLFKCIEIRFVLVQLCLGFDQQMALCSHWIESIRHLQGVSLWSFGLVERDGSAPKLFVTTWRETSRAAQCVPVCVCHLQEHTTLNTVNYSCQRWHWNLDQVYTVTLIPTVLDNVDETSGFREKTARTQLHMHINTYALY